MGYPSTGATTITMPEIGLPQHWRNNRRRKWIVIPASNIGVNYRKRSLVTTLEAKSRCLLAARLVTILASRGSAFTMKLSSPDIAPVGLTRKKRKMNLCMYWKAHPMSGWMASSIDYSRATQLASKRGMVSHIPLSTIPTRSSACCVSETPNEKITAFTTPFIPNVMLALASSTGMMCPIASWVITMVYRTGFVLTTGRSKRSRRLISRFVDTQITNLVMKRLLLA
ncbi:hypothetical protein VCG_000846 [Vibrio cholerae 12129(1)]|nr:hypothetical protein VCG_000846 [Vibrio cholerae 12129(1)]